MYKSLDIVHRDLKPENILLSNHGIIKLCDFGSSKYIDPNGKNTPYIVSRFYRAPELILCITNYSFPIDVWATGCILVELITGHPLFQGDTEGGQILKIFEINGSPTDREYNILKNRVPFNPELFKEFPNYEKNVKYFKKILCDSRDIELLLDLVFKMLAYIPEERITAQKALEHPYFDSIRGRYEQLFNRRSE